MKTKITSLVVLLLGACAWPSSAQPSFDSSGDGLLSGAYYMRQVFYFLADNNGTIGEAVNIQGEITFNGGGSYTFAGTILDSATNSSTPIALNSSGTYVISASGEGYLSALNPNFPNDQVIGLVSHGVFIGSSTENGNGYNDLLIAAPIGSTATNATLKGSYTLAYFDPTFGTSGVGGGGDALLTMAADGQGNIGTVSVTEYLGTNTSATNPTLSGVTYSFLNGAAQLNFGGSAASNLIGGTEVLYVTPDGNFVFGGSANGFDMFAGVRAATSNPSNYDGLYYQAGLDLDNSPVVSSGYSLLDSYFGSLQAFTQEIVGHQRVNDLLVYDGSSDFTYYDSYTLNGNGSSDDALFVQHYLSSTDGTIRIGYGIGPFLSLNVAIQAPSFSGSGVYLNPVGVVNAASSAPFTAFVSPGEFLTLYGTGLSPVTNSTGVPFPPSLNGVQVLINQIPAPVYYISPTQISVIVPYITVPASVAQIQVINNNTNSNVVTMFTGLTSAGVFTNTPEGGTGIAAATRPDGSVISEANPAQIGETEAIYVAGMGAVNPSIADGTAAPDTLNNTVATAYVYLTDSAGNFSTPTVTFSGLAPGFAGLYQINFTIPSGLVSGDGYLEVQGTDSDTSEAILPLTTTPTLAAARDKSKSPRPAHVVHRHRAEKRTARDAPAG